MSEQEYVEVGTDFNPGHPDHAAWRGEPGGAEPTTDTPAEPVETPAAGAARGRRSQQAGAQSAEQNAE